MLYFVVYFVFCYLFPLSCQEKIRNKIRLCTFRKQPFDGKVFFCLVFFGFFLSNCLKAFIQLNSYLFNEHIFLKDGRDVTSQQLMNVPAQN